MCRIVILLVATVNIYLFLSFEIGLLFRCIPPFQYVQKKYNNTVKPVSSRHLRTHASVRLIQGVRLIQVLIRCTVIVNN